MFPLFCPYAQDTIVPPPRLYRSYLPWHYTVAHGEDVLGYSAVRLGGAVAELGSPQLDSVPTRMSTESVACANGQALSESTTSFQRPIASVYATAHSLPDDCFETRENAPSRPTYEVCSPTLIRSNEPKSSLTADAIADISFRTETKTVYVCTYSDCNKTYSRMPDLRRHYRGSHLEDRQFKCRALGCERAIRGFSRRDKRDIHEKKMHIDIGNGILL